MLVLTRKPLQEIVVDGGYKLRVLSLESDAVTLEVHRPCGVSTHRAGLRSEFMLSTSVAITLLRVSAGQARIGIKAPESVGIMRAELGGQTEVP